MRCFLNLAFCIILLATPCFATYPSLTYIVKCPKCGQPLTQKPRSLSAHIEYRYWTEGKVDVKWPRWLYGGTPRLVKCPKCSHLFLIAEAEALAETFYGDVWMFKDKNNKLHTLEHDDELIKKAINPLNPTENDYYEAIASLGGNKKTEKWLRIAGWYLANDHWRYEKEKDAPIFSEKTIENLRSLSAMLDEKDENERIMKAEIARELGHFDASLALLNHDFAGRPARIAAFMKGLCEKKDTKVREIPDDVAPAK